jgi:hypothetical protein
MLNYVLVSVCVRMFVLLESVCVDQFLIQIQCHKTRQKLVRCENYEKIDA